MPTSIQRLRPNTGPDGTLPHRKTGSFGLQFRPRIGAKSEIFPGEFHLEREDRPALGANHCAISPPGEMLSTRPQAGWSCRFQPIMSGQELRAPSSLTFSRWPQKEGTNTRVFSCVPRFIFWVMWRFSRSRVDRRSNPCMLECPSCFTCLNSLRGLRALPRPPSRCSRAPWWPMASGTATSIRR